MSSYPFKDPYYATQHSQPQKPQKPQQPYTDGGDYDPYNSRQQHPTYDQSGYHDRDDDAAATGYKNTSPADEDDGVGHPTREKSRYEEQFPPVFRPPKSTGALRIWRKDMRGPLWAKGGRGRTILRFACCTLFLFLFFLISIILTLFLWVRPPNITINQVALNTTGGSAAQITSTSLNINFGVNISVDNPNYFDVNFKRIKVDLSYPTNDMNLGGGEKKDITFDSDTQTTFNFPFTLSYNLSQDSNRVVLNDLLQKCGFTGSKQDITVDYKITLGLKILVVTINPSFSNSFSFECPNQDIQNFLESAGIDISSLTGLSGTG